MAMKQLAAAADSQVSRGVAVAVAASPKATCGASQSNNLHFLLRPLYSSPVPPTPSKYCLLVLGSARGSPFRLLWPSQDKGHVALFYTTAKQNKITQKKLGAQMEKNGCGKMY